MLIFRRWRGTRAEVRCDQIDFVRFWIERHGASAFLCGDFFDYCEFVRRVLVNHAERGALAIRGERETCAGIEAASIDAFADRYRAIAWDMPGYGGSAALATVSIASLADALQDFLQLTGAATPVLVGHSIGGMIVQQWLVKYPRLAGAVGIGARGKERVIDDIREVRPHHGVGGPQQLAGRPEHRNAGSTRQQRAGEPHVGIEARPRLPGHVLAFWKRTHAFEFAGPTSVKCQCAPLR